MLAALRHTKFVSFLQYQSHSIKLARSSLNTIFTYIVDIHTQVTQIMSEQSVIFTANRFIVLAVKMLVIPSAKGATFQLQKKVWESGIKDFLSEYGFSWPGLYAFVLLTSLPLVGLAG